VGEGSFVIADITNPRSAPLELQALVPDYQIPFVPIIQEGEKPFLRFGISWESTTGFSDRWSLTRPSIR